MDSTSDEVIVGDYILRLDGVALEIFHTSGVHQRFHVNHVKVDAKPKGSDLKITIGVELVKGVLSNGSKIRVPEAQISTIMAFFARATAARTAPTVA